MFPVTTVTLCRKPGIGKKGLLAIFWIILNYGNIVQLPGKKKNLPSPPKEKWNMFSGTKIKIPSNFSTVTKQEECGVIVS